MMIEKNHLSQNEFERIEAYLLDQLNEEDRNSFEKELETNVALKSEVEMQRKMMLAVETSELRNHLNTIHHKLISRRNLTRWLAIAASIAILTTVSFWLINTPDKIEKVFAANMTIDPGLPVPMSATNNYIFYDAMVDYKSGKYEFSINKWEPLLDQNTENDTLNYYLGAANFNSKNYQKAIPFFTVVAQQENSTFFGKSEWYLALSFLATEDIDRLQALAQNSRSDYASRINELIQKLE